MGRARRTEGSTMSVAYYIVLSNDSPGFGTEMDGSTIAGEEEALVKIATDAGLASPLDFFSMAEDEMAELLEEAGAADVRAAEEVWFSAADGLAWVRALQAAVAVNSGLLINQVGVLRDLSDIEAILVNANDVGARWHMAVDY